MDIGQNPTAEGFTDEALGINDEPEVVEEVVVEEPDVDVAPEEDSEPEVEDQPEEDPEDSADEVDYAGFKSPDELARSYQELRSKFTKEQQAHAQRQRETEEKFNQLLESLDKGINRAPELVEPEPVQLNRSEWEQFIDADPVEAFSYAANNDPSKLPQVVAALHDVNSDNYNPQLAATLQFEYQQWQVQETLRKQQEAANQQFEEYNREAQAQQQAAASAAERFKQENEGVYQAYAKEMGAILAKRQKALETTDPETILWEMESALALAIKRNPQKFADAEKQRKAKSQQKRKDAIVEGGTAGKAPEPDLDDETDDIWKEIASSKKDTGDIFEALA